ncbi:MAG: hypothetical protein EON90_07530 [Brevundimonas sp.]|nr:MAG: hypothetical protein EON90_07530 [Brevundimonas sp.]
MTMTIETQANQWIGRLRPWGWGTAVALFLLPLVAMRFTREVVWTTTDFVFWGCLLFGVGVACELAVRLKANIYVRGALCLAAIAAGLLIWVDAAVGLV